MQMRSIEIVVGAFMLAGMVALALLAFRISGFSLTSEAGTYSVFAKFENVGGLVVRAKVTISGVTVGQVAEIRLTEDGTAALVRMDIDDDVKVITSDTTAAILTEGLLGGKFIGLSLGAEDEIVGEGAELHDTQSAIILEELIGKFLLKQF